VHGVSADSRLPSLSPWLSSGAYAGLQTALLKRLWTAAMAAVLGVRSACVGVCFRPGCRQVLSLQLHGWVVAAPPLRQQGRIAWVSRWSCEVSCCDGWWAINSSGHAEKAVVVLLAQLAELHQPSLHA
jgi:hypothetical protein